MPARRKFVDGTRYQFFTRTGLAFNQYGRRSCGNAPNDRHESSAGLAANEYGLVAKQKITV
jgi:hypothetical protein